MHEMQGRCESVQAEMDKANAGTSGLVSRANALRSQQSVLNPPLLPPPGFSPSVPTLTRFARHFAHVRQEISQLFLARFTLTPEETALLGDPSHAAVGRPLFDVMDKVQRIRADCRALFEFVGAEVVRSGEGTEGEQGEGVEGRDVSLVA